MVSCLIEFNALAPHVNIANLFLHKLNKYDVCAEHWGVRRIPGTAPVAPEPAPSILRRMSPTATLFLLSLLSTFYFLLLYSILRRMSTTSTLFILLDF